MIATAFIHRNTSPLFGDKRKPIDFFQTNTAVLFGEILFLNIADGVWAPHHFLRNLRIGVFLRWIDSYLIEN